MNDDNIHKKSGYYASKYQQEYDYLISNNGTDDCYTWVDNYKSKMFRPKVKTDSGSSVYVQYLLLGLDTGSDSVVQLNNTCDNIWCCNIRHLEVKDE